MSNIPRTAAGVLLAAVTALAGCNSPSAPVAEQPAVVAPLPVRMAAYVCPMACEGSASAQPGKCPVCGMALEPNPAAAPKSAPDSL